MRISRFRAGISVLGKHVNCNFFFGFITADVISASIVFNVIDGCGQKVIDSMSGQPLISAQTLESVIELRVDWLPSRENFFSFFSFDISVNVLLLVPVLNWISIWRKFGKYSTYVVEEVFCYSIASNEQKFECFVVSKALNA